MQRYQDIVDSLNKNQNNLSPQEQYYLGISYIHTGNKLDYSLAISLLKTAATANIADAAWELARIYEDGIIAEPDLLQALDWYRLHAVATQKQSPSDAQYFDENGNPTSAMNMLKDIEDRAGNGDIDAQVQIAKIYNHGINTEIDLEKSFEWYKVAANNGNKHAALMTGYFYCRGLGIKKSLQKANFWLAQFDTAVKCH